MTTNNTKVVYTTSETKHWKHLFPNKSMLLGSHNLNLGEELIAEISSVETSVIKDQSGNDNEVAIITFSNVPPMVLNVTNARIIASLYGESYNGWIGQSVQIYATEVRAFGENQRALRIRQIKPAAESAIDEYTSKLSHVKNLDELKAVFTAAPTHIKPHLIKLKDQMKKQLTASQEASNA